MISLERENLDKESKVLDKYKNALEMFKLEEATKQKEINISRSNLKILMWEPYAQKSVEEIEEAYQKLAQSNAETEQLYQKASQQEKDLAPKLAEQKAIVSQTEKQIAVLEKEISENQQTIDKALKEHNFTVFNEVENILLQEINIQEIRAKIQQFRINFGTLKKVIEGLELKLKNLSFDDEQFSMAEKQFEEAHTELKQINDAVVTMNAERERLEKEYRKKKTF